VRWSRRRLARQLAGRPVTAHALTHAHFDHAGCSAWLRPRLACFGHGFAVSDPGRFAAAVQQAAAASW
jgi:glyoxylase-like metal-dependent hydrolase (beta-lactamase superfamily II)